jgi:tetratricopeptide (TPR) repeat protein
MMMFLLVMLVMGGGVSHAQRPQTASEQEQWILGEYWTVVKRYQSGQTAPAIKEMASWPQDRIAKVQSTQFQPEAQLNDLLNSRAEWKPGTLRAAAMLHTEVGLEALRRRDVMQLQFHAGIADGWLNLADDRTSIPGGLRSRWNVAVARVLLLNGEFSLAEGYLDRLNTKIANDAAILLALGTAKESRALRQTADAPAAAGAKPRDPAEVHRERDELRTAAAASFERALTLDATLVEARLRLARIAIDRGDDAGAERMLAALPKGPANASVLYLTNMWIGQIRERQKQWNAAAQSYVDAVKAQPDGQSAYVALAHVLHATGQPVEAAGVLDRWYARGVTSAVADPWWIYPLGLDARLEARFDAIFAEVKAAKDAK